ncbi:hypothetical protein, conserved [Babesia ovata]|uniref:Uncharacterized protein n=1 Tax=Babesia ovata TaxID=189622 RepID=A0A2H6KCB0_9APIC|nr:uncharacterized protein BOVATA_021180 [Babesia ovata]GBE60625.1 hypothetical protein, conserved [Babesia ovata]
MRSKGSPTNSDGHSRETEDIFSEDVKDPSMFMIQSSDEDEEEYLYGSTSTPLESKSVERGTNRNHDFLSAKVNRQYRLGEELYQHDLKADVLLSQINQFFEQSMASLVAAGAKALDDSNTSKDNCKQLPERLQHTQSEDVETVASIVGQDYRNHTVKNCLDTRKRRRKQNTKYHYNEDTASCDGITDEVNSPSSIYVPCNPSNGYKRSSARRTRGKFVNADQMFDVDEQCGVLTPKVLDDEFNGELKVKKPNKRKCSKSKNSKSTLENTAVVSPNVQITAATMRRTTPRVNVKQTRKGKNNKLVAEQMSQKSTGVRNICLKFVIIDENCSVIKDERLEKVIVRHDERIGNLAAKFGKLFDLDENKYKDVKIYIDGDLQPHDIAIGSEMLEIEDGMQVDVKFPQKDAGECLDAVCESTQVAAGYAPSNVVGHIAANDCATEPRDWVSGALFEEVIEID